MLYLKSRMLLTYIEERLQSEPGLLMSADDLARVLEFDPRDAGLLLAIAGKEKQRWDVIVATLGY